MRMDAVIFAGLVLIVAIVAIDALARAAGTSKRPPPPRPATEQVSTEKIVIDLSKR